MPIRLEPLLGLLGYLASAITALVNGSLRVRYCTQPFAGKIPPWNLGSGDGFARLSHKLSVQGGGVGEGHHSPPEEVNDRPIKVRRRLRGKTPIHQVVGREASPPPKRRKWLFLPGPARGDQEGSHFPRIGGGLDWGSPPGLLGIGSRRHQA